jgi:hypothetical protein
MIALRCAHGIADRIANRIADCTGGIPGTGVRTNVVYGSMADLNYVLYILLIIAGLCAGGVLGRQEAGLAVWNLI